MGRGRGEEYQSRGQALDSVKWNRDKTHHKGGEEGI